MMMYTTLPFPKSFPTDNETQFLKLILSTDEEFPALFEAWKRDVVFDDIDYAISRLLPLLYMRLRSLGSTDPIVGRIKGVYKLAWVSNHRLFDATNKIVALFEANNIPVLLLKGTSLLLTVYKDVGARFLGDADILIHPHNAQRAIELMLNADWKFLNPRAREFGRFSSERLEEIAKEATFVNKQGVEIDVHWHVFRVLDNGKIRGVIPFNDLWDHAISITFNNRSYNVVSPEDMLMNVIVHGAPSNPYRGMRWVADAVSIMNEFAIDWNVFLENSKKYNFNVETVVAFSYLVEHGFVVLPQSVATALFNLPLSKKKIKQYYDLANNVPQYGIFGNFPALWKMYWRYDSQGRFPMNVYYFVEYVKHAWGLKKKRELVPFILKKYKDRLVHLKK